MDLTLEEVAAVDDFKAPARSSSCDCAKSRNRGDGMFGVGRSWEGNGVSEEEEEEEEADDEEEANRFPIDVDCRMSPSRLRRRCKSGQAFQ